ncbi:MAG TPA: hypothetical protein VFP84_18615 [Kofleriaceae bacterium]|nr:hypothetical protein [Kofleriaceae bacterium]
MLVPALALAAAACGGNSEQAGAEAAKREAAAEQKAKSGDAAPAKVIATPVPGGAHVPCSQLIDLAAFQTALGEKEPLTIKEVTKSDANAAASCTLVRGGKRPSAEEQKAMLTRSSRLGILPGDDLCNVTAYCWTVEDQDRFQAKCKADKDKDDQAMGSYACVHVSPVGVDDVKSFKFFDEDTKCILLVRGGPSNVNNDSILACAKAARDTIGPAQIQVAAPGGG